MSNLFDLFFEIKSVWFFFHSIRVALHIVYVHHFVNGDGFSSRFNTNNLIFLKFVFHLGTSLYFIEYYCSGRLSILNRIVSYKSYSFPSLDELYTLVLSTGWYYLLIKGIIYGKGKKPLVFWCIDSPVEGVRQTQKG